MIGNQPGPRTRPRRVLTTQLIGELDHCQLVGPDIEISGITFDSRQISPGNLFPALPGADFDGHDFIDKAIERGATALLVDHVVDRNITQLVVPNTRAGLAAVSRAFYGDPGSELTIIGLTGTDGKTTTSYLLDGILRHARLTTGLIGTVGIRIGSVREDLLPHQTTPESNLIQGYLREMVEAGVSHAILEATSHGLAMHRLDGVAFTRAGVTNITHEHLEYHKTMENYRAAKAILVERVAQHRGVVVLNADDAGAMSLAPIANNSEIITYSAQGRPAHLRATLVEIAATGSQFSVTHQNERYRVELPLIGDFNVANALCAMGLALSLAIPIETVIEALAVASGVPGRMVRVDEGQAFSVVVDYAHTPEALTRIMTLLRTLHPDGRLIVVSGSAGERDVAKRPLQGAACQRLADISIFTNEDPRNENAEAIIADIARGAVEAGGTRGQTFHEVTDRREALALSFSLASPGDCVLLAGKGHETSIIIGYEHHPWNEETVARELLSS